MCMRRAFFKIMITKIGDNIVDITQEVEKDIGVKGGMLG